MPKSLSRLILTFAAFFVAVSSSDLHAQITYSGRTLFRIESSSSDPMGLRPDNWNGTSTVSTYANWDMTFADHEFTGDPDPTTFMFGSITVNGKVLDIVKMDPATTRPMIFTNREPDQWPYTDFISLTFEFKRTGYSDVVARGNLRYEIPATAFTFGSPKKLPTFSWQRSTKIQYSNFKSYGYSFRNYGGIQAVETPNQDPVAVAGPDQEVQCAGELTEVNLSSFGSSDPDGDELSYEWSIAGASSAVLVDPDKADTAGFFPHGPTLVTLTVDDGKGGIAVDDVLIVVVDTTPPVLICTTDKIALWPPNHRMEDVIICVAASDACDDPEQLTIDCTISSNEADDSNGDGSSIGDVNNADGFTAPVTVELEYEPVSRNFYGVVSLRAERLGAGSGRNYSIVAKVTDSSNNESTASCVVVVPRDKRKK